MKKGVVVFGLVLSLLAVVSAHADDGLNYNGIDLAEYLGDDNELILPYPLYWSDWEKMCYEHDIDPDYEEYKRFGEDYGGNCGIDEVGYDGRFPNACGHSPCEWCD